MDRHIVCIEKKLSVAGCSGIAFVGVSDSEYTVPVSKVIQLIESGKDSFYVTDKDGSKVPVHVAQRKNSKYIKTQNDPHDILLTMSLYPFYQWYSVFKISQKVKTIFLTR